MAERATDIFTETQGGRFDVSAWREGGHEGVWTQVLDLRPYRPEAECRFVKVLFGGFGQTAHTRSDHSLHTLRMGARGAWLCDCEAGKAGRVCYHKRAVLAAIHLADQERRQFLTTAPRMPRTAPAAVATW